MRRVSYRLQLSFRVSQQPPLAAPAGLQCALLSQARQPELSRSITIGDNLNTPGNEGAWPSRLGGLSPNFLARGGRMEGSVNLAGGHAPRAFLPRPPPPLCLGDPQSLKIVPVSDNASATLGGDWVPLIRSPRIAPISFAGERFETDIVSFSIKFVSVAAVKSCRQLLIFESSTDQRLMLN
jgi:hypothetical protein